MCIDVQLVRMLLRHAEQCLEQAQSEVRNEKYSEWKLIEAVRTIELIWEHMKGVKLENGEIDMDALVHSVL